MQHFLKAIKKSIVVAKIKRKNYKKKKLQAKFHSMETDLLVDVVDDHLSGCEMWAKN